MKIRVEKNKSLQFLMRVFLITLPWALSSCSSTPSIKKGLPSPTAQVHEGLTSNSVEVVKEEGSDLVSFDGVTLELAESGEAYVVFEGILTTNSEAPRAFGARETHKIPQVDFRPKSLKTVNSSDQLWMLVEIRSELFWVIK
jgi:hypothetical protein